MAFFVVGVEERFSRDILHDHEEHPVDLSGIVDTDQVRVGEVCHRFRFGLEGVAEREVAAEFTGKNFDRDIPIQSWLTSLVDGTRSALGNQVLEFERRQKL